MGSCIICGASVDGRICSHHEEDALFEFRGDNPNQLTPGRYYRGTVDGYAEFGVFIDIGDRVTGLLHRSELDRRLDSLDWDPGDVVYVEVQSIRDNGNVDLGWSIRQDEREFRGTLVDDPALDHAKVKSELGDETESDAGDDANSDAEDEAGNAHSGSDASPGDAAATNEGDGSTAGSSGGPEAAGSESQPTETASRSAATQATADVDDGSRASSDGTDGSGPRSRTGGETATASGSAGAVTEETREPTQVTVDELADRVGEFVRLEGTIAEAHQTGGPTIFQLRDEDGTVECAAFVEAGVRAYPDVGPDDVVRLDGEVEQRRGEIQVETEALVVLDAEDREAVERRMADALEDRARPDAVDPLAADDVVDALSAEIEDAATAICKAVLTDRPVIVRHAATADGYVAGAAIERATLPLVEDAHTGGDAAYHYFDRRPLEGGVYDMDDATRDVTGMLENRQRHGEKLPLFVFVAAGGTRESADGFELLSIYGAPRVVVDEIAAEEAVREAVETIVSPGVLEAGPDQADGPAATTTTATALAANVAAHVNDDVRADLRHLPAVSFWAGTPESYVAAAEGAGYDADAVRDLRQAVALEAFYQSYEDKRELIAELLFGDDEDDVSALAANVAEQFRTKIDAEVETARANLEREGIGDYEVAVLDTDAFTHRYDFPPASLLLDQLWRTLDADALLGIGTDALYLRNDAGTDVHAVADAIDEIAPEAGVSVHSTRERRLRYLAGERDAVRDATLAVLAERL
jgi:RecJ-like exonuclease